MANIKTAISIDEALFREAERIRKVMKISRSGLFAVALEEFIERRRTQAFLEKINDAYTDAPTPDDRRYLKQMRKKHRGLVDRW